MIEKFFKVTRKEKTIMGRKELLSLVERVDSNSSASPAEISFDEYIFDGSDEKKNVTQNDFVSLLKAAAKCKHLHSMSFPNDFLINEVTLEPIVDLFSNKHIREVKFNHAIGLTGENLEKVCDAIRGSKHLVCVGFRGAQFSGDELGKVVESLREHPSVQELSFQWCDLRVEGMARVAGLVGAGSRVRALDLRGNNLGPEGCKTLGAALRENSSVETLHLEENEIGSLGAAYVCHVLFGREGSVALKNIFLDSNYIGDNGALAAATTLEKCGRGIVQLSLRDNGIHAKCGSKIAAAALKSDSLTYLDLESNFLTDEGALQFAIVIERNARLKYLNLANNGIREVGGEKIGQALMRNTSLLSLDLQCK